MSSHRRVIHQLHLLVVIAMLIGMLPPALAPARVAAAPAGANARPGYPVNNIEPARTAGPATPVPPNPFQPAGPQPTPAPITIPSPVPVLPPAPPAAVKVIAEPATAKPGDDVTLTVQIEAQSDLDQAEITGNLPRGIEFASAEGGPAARYDTQKRVLSWPLGRVRRGQASFRLHMRLGEDAPDLLVQQIQLRIPGAQGSAVGEVEIRRAFPAVEVRITPDKGGELRSADGRVRLIIPPGATDKPLRIRHQPQSVNRLANSPTGMATVFTLDAVTDDAAATPLHQFAKPVEVRVDVSGLIELGGLQYWQSPALAYKNEQTGAWEFIGTTVEGTTLVAQLPHFSTIGDGIQKEAKSGWLLAFNDAQVSTFSGALGYNYPIAVPEGRGGLTPDVTLNYDSKRIDGILTWIQSDWTGLGWSLDDLEMVRYVRPNNTTETNGTPKWMSQNDVDYYSQTANGLDTFALKYKGTSYNVLPSAGGPGNSRGLYHTDIESFFFITRCNSYTGTPGPANASPENTTGEYWLVRDRDGTEYRLGYQASSEQIIPSSQYGTDDMNNPADWQYFAGRVPGTVAWRWRVDQIKDVHGNLIQFQYEEDTNPICGPARDVASYLKTILYNFDPQGHARSRVTFNRANRNSDTVQDTWDGTIGTMCELFRQQEFLSSIKVETSADGNTWQTLAAYALTYDKDDGPWQANKTRRLAGIKQYGTTGITANPADVLATTAFTYHPMVQGQNEQWNKKGAQSGSDWDMEYFRYARLEKIDNGFGGVITAAYAGSPFDTDIGEPVNYRVTQKTVEDGRGGGQKITYDYDLRRENVCYMANGVYGCDAGATQGSLTGYHTVTETLKMLSDQTVSMTRHSFWLNTVQDRDRRLGREYETVVMDAAYTPLNKTATDWIVDTLSGPERFFVHTGLTREYDKPGVPEPPQRQSYTAYDLNAQQGTQYGNLTHVIDYEPDGTTIYRCQYTAYWPKNDPATNAYIVNRPGIEQAYAGFYPQTPTLLASTLYFYDGQTNYQQAPGSRGDVTRVEKLKDASGQYIPVQTTAYNGPFGLPDTIGDARGYVTRITYDAAAQHQQTVTTALGTPAEATVTYGYDNKGRLETVTDANGATTSYGWDNFGRLTALAKPGNTLANPTESYQYGTYSASPYRPLPITTTVVYTSSTGSLLQLPTLRYYDGLGRLIREQRGTTNQSSMSVSEYVYNAKGQQAESYAPYMATYSTAYQAPIDRGNKTTTAYDALGRPVSVTNPDGTVARTFYDGLRRTVVDEKNQRRDYIGDGLGRVTTVEEYQDPYPNAWLYATTSYEYDERDLLVKVTAADQVTTTMQYDALGRKTGMHDPDMGNWSYEYDGAGNLTKQIDAKTQQILFTYDPLNRLSTKDYGGNGTDVTYEYDQGAGNRGYRTRMLDNENHETKWAYDSRGRVISETQKIGLQSYTTNWTYNAQDQVVQQTYPAISGQGETVKTAYGVWDQPATLTSLTYTGANYVTSMLPDAAGRIDLLKLGNNSTTPTILVDNVYYNWGDRYGRGQLKQIKSDAGTTNLQDLRYTYDDAGNVQQILDYRAGIPGSGNPETLTYSYDSLNRLNGMTGSGGVSGDFGRAFGYAANGNLADKTTSSYTFYGYDAKHPHAVNTIKGTGGTSGKTLTVRARVGQAGATAALTLRINGQDTITQTKSVTTTAYQDYSFLVTLRGDDIINVVAPDASSSKPLSVESITVDGGAPITMTVSSIFDAGSGSAAFDGQGVKLGSSANITTTGALRVVRGGAAYAASYDENGNMTSRVVQGKAMVMTWDAENRLTQVQQNSGTTSYSYDGDGHRFLVVNGGTATTYIGNYFEVTNGAATSYYYHAGKRVALRNSSGVYYLLGDHLGSTNVSYKSDGSATTYQRYAPWGGIRAGSGGMPTDYGFTGQRLDSGSGLVYYGARWYDPTAARWLSPDTIVPSAGDPQNLNRYSYVLNNPLSYRDPTGHNPQSWLRSAGDFATGLTVQFGNDMLGPFSDILGKCKPEYQAAIQLTLVAAQIAAAQMDIDLPAPVDDTSEAYYAGQAAGRAASNAVAFVEMVGGAVAIVCGITIVLPSGGAATVLSTALGPEGPVLSGAATVVVVGAAVGGGAAVAGHGIAVLLHNYANSGLTAGDTTPHGRKFTNHSALRGNSRSFTGGRIDDIVENYSRKVYQYGGKTVYAQSRGGWWDVVILNRDGDIVSVIGGSDHSLANWSAVERMLGNNGGYSTIPLD